MARGAARSVRVAFWGEVRRGLPVYLAARAVGVHGWDAQRWFREAGGVIGNGTRPVSGRYLSLVEREEIAVGLAAGWSLRRIAAGLGRSAATVSREVARGRSVRG